MTLSRPSSPYSTLVTAHDAITDSPIYRAGVVHSDEQFDLLDKWLSNLTLQYQQYVEKISRLNLDTVAICEKIVPPASFDDGLIASSFSLAAARMVSDAFQKTMASHTKLVLEVQTHYLEPISQFVKSYLKDYKDFRKLQDKCLDRYEHQIQRYSGLSRNKDVQTLREEAGKLYEARKDYIQRSMQHMQMIAEFRNQLANLLVDRISSANIKLDEISETVEVWRYLKTILKNWKTLLIDDRQTCAYEMAKLNQVQEKLQNDYLRLVQPRPDIGFSLSSPVSIENQPKLQKRQQFPKWGYLLVRVSRNTWSRKWCFLCGDVFGWCGASTKGGICSVAIDTRVKVSSSEVEILKEIDRRFCFKVINKKRQFDVTLQAETEEDMRDWISSIQQAKDAEDSLKMLRRRESLDNKSLVDSVQPSSPSTSSISSRQSNPFQSGSPVRLSTKAKSTTTITTPKDIPVMLSTSKSSKISGASRLSEITGLSITVLATEEDKNSSSSARVVLYSSTPQTPENATLNGSLSLTPTLVWESSTSHCAQSYSSLPEIWGVPWPLLGSVLFASKASFRSADGETSIVSWPFCGDADLNLPTDIVDYPQELVTENHVLRQLFGGVKRHELVLDVFFTSLRLKSWSSANNPTIANAPDVKYGYGGKLFLTQDTLWFYSCIMMTRVTSLVVRLKDINEVHVTKDTIDNKEQLSVALQVKPVKDDGTNGEPFIFAVFSEDARIVVEKLRFAIDNAKNQEPMQLRNVFNKIKSLSGNRVVRKERSVSCASTDSAHGVSPTGATRKKGRLSFRSMTRPTLTPAAKKIDGREVVTLSSSLEVAPPPVETKPAEIKSAVEKDKMITKSKDIKTKVEEKKVMVTDPDALPEGMEYPKKQVSCKCDDHLDKLETEIELPISAKRLYELMFSDEQNAPPTNGGVWEKKTTGTEGHDLRVSRWEKDDEDGQLKRTLKYIMPVSNPIVRMKEAEVVETQVLIKKQNYICYVVQISTRTAALPFADAFIPSVRYCITWVDKSRCKLVCHLGVRWVKSVLVRAIVTKAAMKGMGDSIAVFVPILEEAAANIAKNLKNAPKEPLIEDTRIESVQDTEGYDDDCDEERGEQGNTEVGGQINAHVQDSSPTTRDLQYNADKENSSNSSSASSDAATEESAAVAGQTTVAKALLVSKEVKTTTRYPLHTARLHTVQQSNNHHHLLRPPSLHSRTHSSRRPSKSSSTSSNEKKTRRSSRPQGRQFAPKRIFMILLCFIILCNLGSWKLLNTAIDVSEATASTVDHEIRRHNSTTTTSFIPVTAHKDVRTMQSPKKKGVYLLDLETGGYLHSKFQAPYVNTQSFQLFLRAMNPQQHISAGIEQQEYRWQSLQRHQYASDLDVSRDRLAVMRQDILMLFKLLNKMDAQLRESEYMNWLLDNRARCLYGPGTQQDHVYDQAFIQPDCQEVAYHLHTYFL